MENTEDRRRILTVRELNDEIAAAVDRAFPRTVWVRGEVQRLPADAARRTHVYFELHETGASGAAEYAIPVSLMGWDRQKFGLGRFLDDTDPDVQIANKLEVCLECRVDFYAKFGKLSLKIVGVDRHFSLGKLEARRRAVLAHLKEAGLLEANAAVPLPDLPLHVGLITSQGSAAERDFVTGLEASPWAFRLRTIDARMQGEQTETGVIRALAAHAGAGVDAVVIARGGGSRADLSWFDQQGLAEAIARCPVPVITAIGHEIDTSIADLVAHHACKTPTAAAEFLVERVDEAAARLQRAADGIALAATAQLDEAARQLEVGERLAAIVRAAVLDGRIRLQRTASWLQAVAGRRVATASKRLANRQAQLGAAAAATVARGRERLGRGAAVVPDRARNLLSLAGARLRTFASGLGREAPRTVSQGSRRLESLDAQVRLQDPRRLFSRGFSLTRGPDGKALIHCAQVQPGDTITTLVSDGSIISLVEAAAINGLPVRKKARRARKSYDEPELF